MVKKVFTIKKVRVKRDKAFIGIVEKIAKESAKRIDAMMLKALCDRYGKMWILGIINNVESENLYACALCKKPMPESKLGYRFEHQHICKKCCRKLNKKIE